MGNRMQKNSPSSSNTISPNSLPSATSALENNGINFETFSLVWLDIYVDKTEENISTQHYLREILGRIIIFDDIMSCEAWLKNTNHNKKVVLIVSGKSGSEIVPKIHFLESIISVYVYCRHTQRYQSWAKNYPKIRHVTSDTDDLVKHVLKDHKNLESIEDSNSIKISPLDVEPQIASYFWYHLFLEVLTSDEYLPIRNTFDILINILETCNANDEYGLKLIRTFEEYYSPDDAVLWLVDETPLGSFVNKVLRDQDITMLFALRFFLIDIYKQLVQYRQNALDVYRLQPMTLKQIENIKANPGHLVQFSGFLFGTTKKKELLSTVVNNKDFEIVLMHIETKNVSDATPFALLHNCIKDFDCNIEHEVLFMCGSLFEIGEVVCDSIICTIHLKLVDPYAIPCLKALKQDLRITKNLCIIGDLLKDSQQNDKAATYYQEMVKNLRRNHELIPRITKALSVIQNDSKTFVKNVQCLLIGLKPHMNDFALAMLKTLQTLIPDIILEADNDSVFNPPQTTDQEISIFTTKQWLKLQNNISPSCNVYILEMDINNFDKNTFPTIELLISKLVDEIIAICRSRVNQYKMTDQLTKAKEIESKINQISRKIRQIHDQFANRARLVISAEPMLVWMQPDEEDMQSIRNHFNDFFTAYHELDSVFSCHYLIAETENDTNIFLILNSENDEIDCCDFAQFSNVVNVYFYKKSAAEGNKRGTNANDLFYHITQDLISYYAELGDRYEANNRWTDARQIFLKGKKLCLMLQDCFK